MTSADRTVELIDGVQVVVPDDLALITPYVLQEQGDWFEDELRFVRAWAQPGFRALDVGANYGVFTLTLARRAGAGGRVWAVEPGADVLAYLARSVAANGFTNVELLGCALSRADGRGTLGGAASPELRRLTATPEGGQAVDIRTLDRAAAEHGIERVDFVKIDAEGEEINVLAGGAAFFARESPLLMLELKNGDAVNEDLFAPLARLGCAGYRLCPGLNVLVPFSEAEEPDAYQLNLFAAKADRAQALAAAGWLANGEAVAPAPDAATLERLFALPYASEAAGHWRAWLAGARRETYAEALMDYALSRDAAAGPDMRAAALERAFLRLADLAAAKPTLPHLASFVRAAADWGRRAEAVAAAGKLLALARQAPPEALAVPLLSPSAFHETLAPTEAARWLVWATLEYLECARAFSSFYCRSLLHHDYGLALDDRYASPALRRRAAVFARRS